MPKRLRAAARTERDAAGAPPVQSAIDAALAAQRERHAAAEAAAASDPAPEPVAAAALTPAPPSGYTYDATRNRLFRMQLQGLATALPSFAMPDVRASAVRSTPPPWRCVTLRAAALISPESLPRAVVQSWTCADWRPLPYPQHVTALSVAAHAPQLMLAGTEYGSLVTVKMQKTKISMYTHDFGGAMLSPITSIDQVRSASVGGVSEVCLTTMGAAHEPGALHTLLVDDEGRRQNCTLEFHEPRDSMWSCCWLDERRIACGSSTGVNIVTRQESRRAHVQHAATSSDVVALLPTTDSTLLLGLRNGNVLLHDARAAPASMPQLWRLPCSVQHVADMTWPYVAIADVDATLCIKTCVAPAERFMRAQDTRALRASGTACRVGQQVASLQLLALQHDQLQRAFECGILAAFA